MSCPACVMFPDDCFSSCCHPLMASVQVSRCRGFETDFWRERVAASCRTKFPFFLFPGLMHFGLIDRRGCDRSLCVCLIRCLPLTVSFRYEDLAVRLLVEFSVSADPWIQPSFTVPKKRSTGVRFLIARDIPFSFF